MHAMGWRPGEGLGANGGLTAPLQVQKSAVHSGIVLVEASKRPRSSSVLRLRGMVGTGEVDAGLEDEVARECERHGPVRRVLIYERTEGGISSDEAVRIYVEFVHPQDAALAAAAFNGRWFGGRIISSNLVDATRLEAGEFD